MQCWVGKGLDEHDRVPPARLEVSRQPAEREAEHLRGEVRPSPLGKDAETLVVRDIAQPAVTLAVAPGQELFPGAHAERRGAEADQRTPLAVFYRDVAHHLADEAGAEPVLCSQSLVEALPLAGGNRANDERGRARHYLPSVSHPRSCSTWMRMSVSTVASAEVRQVCQHFAGALSTTAWRR